MFVFVDRSHTFINPAALFTPAADGLRLDIAARRHRYTHTFENCYEDELWESSIVLAQLDLATETIIGQVTSYTPVYQHYHPNDDPAYVYIPENNSYYRKRSTGPEDPRLLRSGY